jgi:hypothetical protein
MQETSFMSSETAALKPIPEASLRDYFRSRLRHSARRLNLDPGDDTLWYLGDLLHRYGRSDQLFDYYEGHRQLRPLALLYDDARSAPSEPERCLILQRLGDLALFLGALFPERYARRGIHRDYFVGMGGGAYDYLADRARSKRHIFRELTHHFSGMIELVAAAGSRHSRLSHGDLLKLYERWMRSGNPAMARQLSALGVVVPGKRRDH